jgi:hypothetical protein
MTLHNAIGLNCFGWETRSSLGMRVKKVALREGRIPLEHENLQLVSTPLLYHWPTMVEEIGGKVIRSWSFPNRHLLDSLDLLLQL